jgi:hypothetical protein
VPLFPSPKLRTILTLTTVTTLTLTSLTTLTLLLRSRVQNKYDLSQHSARMDEMERTLGGQVGSIEDALDRLDAETGTGKRKEWGVEAWRGIRVGGLYEAR